MKKKSILALVMMLIMVCIFTLSACDNAAPITTTEGLAKCFEKINNSDNFTGKLTFSESYDDVSANITMELQVDSNKFRISMKEFYDDEIMEELVYIEIDEESGVIYGYAKNYRTDEWEKQEIDLVDINEEIQFMLDLEMLQAELFGIPDNALFNAENYVYSEEDDCFIFNEEGFENEFLDVIKFTVKATEDKVTFRLIPEIEDGFAQIIEIKVEFYDFGETTVRLPDVTPNNPPVNTTTLEQAFEKLEETNLRIAYTMEMKGISMTIEAGFDFNLAYIDLLGTTFYMEIDLSTGISYIYIPDDYGRYTKAKGSIDDILGTGDSSDDGSMDFIYDASSYEYSSYEERYVLKQSAIDNRSGITGGYLVFDNDSITITMTQLSDDGTEMTLTMRFYDFGKVTVELPSTNN